MTTSWSGGFWQVQCIEEVELLRSCFAGAVEGAFANMGGVLLYAREQVKGGARACAVSLGLQAHAHDAVEDEREETDHGVRADAIGQPVMHRRDLDIRFQYAKAALDTP